MDAVPAGPLRQPLSATLITLDAASQLAATLASLSFCDDIVVVDSGSRDDTLAIARAHGARVIEAQWRGFGPQKQLAVAAARHDWVLCVDADERVSDELRASIVAALTAPTPHHSAYRFARCNRFLGRYLRHGEGYPDLSLRLFDRRLARWSDDLVHEKVLIAEVEESAGGVGSVGRLTGDLWHDSAETLESYLAKQNRYTSLAAQQALAAGKHSSVAQMLLSPLTRFIKFYIVRRGFLDGLPGLIHILIGCMNSFIKHAKIIELHLRKSVT